MNTKNRLIEALLRVAKKHKVLTYPVLALVAVISIVDYFFSWSTGAGKRVVAIVMVLVMLVSQSYFLTSSATELVDDEEAALVQMELQEEVIADEPEEVVETKAEPTTEKVTEAAAESEAVADTSTQTSADSSNLYMQEEVITDDPDEEVTMAEENPELPMDAYPYTDADVEDDLEEEELDSKLSSEKGLFICRVSYSGNENGMLTGVDVDRNDDGTYNCQTACSNAFNTLNASGSVYRDDDCYEFVEEWYDYNTGAQISDTSKVTASTRSEGQDIIYLYCKRVLKKYKVTIKDKDNSDAVYTVNGNSNINKETPVYVTSENGTATVTITSATRDGYSFVSANGNSMSSGSVSVTIGGDDFAQTITTVWRANQYAVIYNDANGVSSGSPQIVTYDQDAMVEDSTGHLGDDIPDGKIFKTWKIKGTSTTIDVGANLKNYQGSYALDSAQTYQGYKVVMYLEPVFVPDEILITKAELGFEYDTEDSKLIQAYYKTKGEPDNGSKNNLTYSIKTAASTLEKWERQYGITVTADTNGITVGMKTGAPEYYSNLLTLTIAVKDKIRDAEVDTEEFSIEIDISPKEVQIDTSAASGLSKIYDGTADVSDDFNTAFPAGGGSVTVTFNECQYEDANAGTRKIILNDASLEVSDGKDSRGYKLVLDENWVTGTIEKRPVDLETYAEPYYDSVETGEATPFDKFHVKADEARNRGEDTGFIQQDLDNAESIEELLGVTFELDRERIDLTETFETYRDTEYRIYANLGESNYDGVVTKYGAFKVVQKAPEQDTNYQISGKWNEETEWYIDGPAQISPVGNYNVVRVSKDKTDISEGRSATPVNITDDKEGTYYVQLYNETSGAYTSWKRIRVRVDEKAPQYDSFTISVDGEELNLTDGEEIMEGGRYFPGKGRALTFGNYFNNTLTVSIHYTDEVSGLKSLHYKVFGETEETIGFSASGVATFEIPVVLKEKIGEILFYAEDQAGNVEAGSFDAESGLNKLKWNGDVTEWGVEAGAPALSSVKDAWVIYAGEYHAIRVVSGSDTYYANCMAQLKVTDYVSGIYNVTWNVNGQTVSERVDNVDSRQTEYTFTKNINASTFPGAAGKDGKYVVYATVADNADNTVTTDSIEFYVDDEPPVISVTDDYDKNWQTSARLEFSTYDDLSDIKYISVTDEQGNLIEHHVDYVEETSERRISHCYFETTKNGTFYIVVSDIAGNVAQEKIVFSRVSDVTPDCPEITIIPDTPDGNNGWYTSMPSYRIKGAQPSEGEAPISTQYMIWREGEEDLTPSVISGTELLADFTREGIFHLKAWSEAATGKQCANADEHESVVQIDTTDPKITFEATRGSGSTILVHFEITDTGSGVDSDRILVLHGTKDIPAKIEETENGYEGSFEITELGNYSIQAADFAGNTAESISFTPMSMKIRPVTNITDDSVTLGAIVIRGTFDITNATLSYRKYADSEYTEVTDSYITQDSAGNWNVSAVVSGLDAGNVYSYKVTATSAADEVLEYEGLFKTLSYDKGISVMGTARYANDEDGTITVALFDGNICSMALQVKAGNEFVFNNVPDGNYNIVASDGVYSKSMRVLIKDGLIVYPENYIELVLSGKNTGVVVTTDDTPHVTADNMDSIFSDDLINFTTDDSTFIMNGGTIEFKLYATLMPVTNVSADEIAAMYAVTDRSKIVGAYLDLSLYKIATSADGDVVSTRVTDLASGANISVTIPLGELAGKPGLEVVRIHDTGDQYIGASLVDQDTNPNTYTITTSQFSTYAVLYSVGAAQTETTQTTEQGGTPVTTDGIQEGTTGPSTDGSIYTPVSGSSQQDPPGDDSTEDAGSDDEKKDIQKPDTGRRSSVGSLKSSGSAKTGDTAPIAGMVVVMALAAGGFIILRKNKK